MDCAICFDNENELFKCPLANCNKSICYDCINSLIQSNTTECPFCKNSINYNNLFHNVIFEFEYNPMENNCDDDDQC